jgi:4-oxalocrotonate tautomerase
MPIISVVTNHMATDDKRELVRELTATAARVMKLPPETITVLIDCRQPEDIGVAGVLLADRKK